MHSSIRLPLSVLFSVEHGIVSVHSCAISSGVHIGCLVWLSRQNFVTFSSPNYPLLRFLLFSSFGCNRYMERDPVRGKDSFAAFEEMLLLAKERKVRRDSRWTQ